ncbi:ABC-type branched-subunit amino acid transport system substrate-binding protein [Paraburkholderia bryophila]|uniref:ABC-type branched-subunit amino acid transport system substrate-binding protein n=1 Tax=Paraburkholderia bryophila TaxID=420952 RepID=A0A7Z0B3W0_9BURK|nr:ABC-type branched-subunit amino acid transport system substrate-binding protein [Paraburkholderia bryophila]
MAKWQRAAAGALAVISIVAAGYAAAQTAASQAPAFAAKPATQPASKPTGAPIQLALIEGMSGPFANAGAAVERNLRFGVEQVNAQGGVKLADGAHPFELVVLDSKGSAEEALTQVRAAADRHIGYIMQGNSSAVAAALIGAIDKQNSREPANRELFLNYSADDPALTNANCSFWHFRFDAHAGMRMDALADVIQRDKAVKKVYLLNQDYSFGHDVSSLARSTLAAKRPDIAVVGDEFHPIGRVKDFAPYIAKIRASGADAVITGNWGNDLTLLVKAAREQGLDTKFYTFYGNSLGAPARARRRRRQTRDRGGRLASERGRRNLRRLVRRLPGPFSGRPGRLPGAAYAADGRNPGRGDEPCRQRRPAGRRPRARGHQVRQRLPRLVDARRRPSTDPAALRDGDGQSRHTGRAFR